jgi:outer membrane protein TolC
MAYRSGLRVLELEQQQLSLLRERYRQGIVDLDELSRQELKVGQARLRLIEVTEPPGSPTVNAARLEYAKLTVDWEQKVLDMLRARHQAGLIGQDEMNRQELRIVEAMQRLAEIKGRAATAVATKPATATAPDSR